MPVAVSEIQELVTMSKARRMTECETQIDRAIQSAAQRSNGNFTDVKWMIPEGESISLIADLLKTYREAGWSSKVEKDCEIRTMSNDPKKEKEHPKTCYGQNCYIVFWPCRQAQKKKPHAVAEAKDDE